MEKKMDGEKWLGRTAISIIGLFALALVKGENKEEVIRKHELSECFTDVTSDFSSFSERSVELDRFQRVDITTVSTKEGEQNIRYLLEWNQVTQEQPRKKPAQSSSLNSDFNPYKKAIFVGGGENHPPATVYRQIEPSEEQLSNLEGFQSCIGLGGQKTPAKTFEMNSV